MHDQWNHNNYTVPRENLSLLGECLTTLMPWERWIDHERMLGYRFTTEFSKGSVFFQPSDAASALVSSLQRLRQTDAELDAALRDLAAQPADVNDHNGFMVADLDEWEERVQRFEQAIVEHPEWQLALISVQRPGQPGALNDRLYTAFLRIGLLGPVRNTFEMQCVNPAVV